MNIEKVKKLRKGQIYRIKETRYTGPDHHLCSAVVDPVALLGNIQDQDLVLFLDWHFDKVYVRCQVLKGDVVGWFISAGMELLEVERDV